MRTFLALCASFCKPGLPFKLEGDVKFTPPCFASPAVCLVPDYLLCMETLSKKKVFTTCLVSHGLKLVLTVTPGAFQNVLLICKSDFFSGGFNRLGRSPKQHATLESTVMSETPCLPDVLLIQYQSACSRSCTAVACTCHWFVGAGQRHLSC